MRTTSADGLRGPLRGKWPLVFLLGSACTGTVGDGLPAPEGAGTQTTADEGRGTPSAPAKSCVAPPARIWKLTPDQYTRSVQALLGTTARPGDELRATVPSKNLFSNEAAVLELSEPHTADLHRLTGDLAREAARAPAALRPCLANGAPDAACVQGFVQDFGARAFRRPLAADEVTTYVAFFQKHLRESDAETALRLTLSGILLSPSFLFRTELGPDRATAPGATIELTPFEKASALSYFLTDGPPDATLAAAAARGQLDTRDQLEAQARRLLSSPKTASGVLRFFAEHLDLDGVRASAKDPALFPQWKDPLLAADMAKEAEQFVTSVLWEKGTLETLLTASTAFVTSRLAPLYGVAAPPAGAETRRTSLPAARAGVLTLPAVMARLARESETDPVKRGVFVRRRILCQPPAPPPKNVPPIPARSAGTWRQRLAVHSANAGCAVCHRDFDGLGLSFEIFDAIGRYRTQEGGKAIDASGTLTRAMAEGAPFTDALDLMRLLAKAPEAQSCAVEKAFAYANGRAAAPGESCALDRLAGRFGASGGNLLDLVVAMVTDDSFLLRTASLP